jgi:hypothetical protein
MAADDREGDNRMSRFFRQLKETYLLAFIFIIAAAPFFMVYIILLSV